MADITEVTQDMIIKQCDRCGMIYSPKDNPQKHNTLIRDCRQLHAVRPGYELDICPDCMDQLNKWLEEGKS